MANDPNQDGYKDYTDEQLAALPGAPKRGQNGGYVYGWRPQPYQDVLSEQDIKDQPAIYQYRAQYGEGATADDDLGALAQMRGQSPLANSNTYAPVSGYAAGNPSISAMSSWTGSTTTPATLPNRIDTNLPSYNDPRKDALFNTLLQRSEQSLNVNPLDPVIAGQVNPYRAEQERGARNYIDAQAEAQGPYANLGSERRLAAETAAQNTGAFQGQLLQRDLEARRNEVAQALSSRSGILSQDEQFALQRDLAELNAALSQRGQDIGFGLSSQGLSNDLLRTMLQNQQFNQGLQSQNDQFAAQLGLTSADRAAYWDALRRGLLY